MNGDLCFFHENREMNRENKIKNKEDIKEFEMKEIIRKKGVCALYVRI